MIIDGKKVESCNVFEVKNPFTGEVIGAAVNATIENINDALDKSYKFNCHLSFQKRAEILIKTAETLERGKEEYAKIITSESGLSLKDTLYEVGRVINCAKYSAKVCKLIEKDTTRNFILDEENYPQLKVITEPLDLVVGITPFNHPMNQVAHKVFPAIAAGTAMVLKPSEKTPLSAIKLVEILYANGLPNNMINIVTGKNGKMIAKTLLSYLSLDMVTFTGGVKVGHSIRKSMVENGNGLKRYVPELGGSSSLIICHDADLDLAAKITRDGCFKNSGQRCTSIRRVLIENKVADQFLEKFLPLVKSIKYGNPYDLKTDMGPVITESSAIEIQKRINAALQSGAKLLYGNKRKGALLGPTVLDNVDLSMELVQKETFGPVCPLFRIQNLNEAIDLANNTKYRLAGAIITKDESKGREVCDKLKVGQFSLNGPPGFRTEAAPFGGFGDSGNGEKEGIILAAHGMCRIRTFYRH